MLPSEELIAAFLIGFALGTLVRNEQLKKATEQRDRAENMLRNVSKEYWEDEDFSIGQDGMFYDNKYTEDGQA